MEIRCLKTEFQKNGVNSNAQFIPLIIGAEQQVIGAAYPSNKVGFYPNYL